MRPDVWRRSMDADDLKASKTEKEELAVPTKNIVLEEAERGQGGGGAEKRWRIWWGKKTMRIVARALLSRCS